MSNFSLLIVLAGLGVLISSSQVVAQQPDTMKIKVQPQQSVAFLGASITEQGMNSPQGYIQLVIKNLAANNVPIQPISAGVSGNTSRDMLARLEKDVLAKKPDWVFIDAGGNDVWHGDVDFAEYMSNMTAIVEKSQQAHIRVLIQTCTPIGEDPANEFNPKMVYFNAFLRYLAAQKHCDLADLNADSLAVLKTKTGRENLLTTDGVHMNDRGNVVMAAGVLRALGLTGEQIARTIPSTP